MAIYTRNAILRTFQAMLEEMPFDKITVSALVKRCQISSNTFYYHYQDIYQLLDAWLAERLGQYAGEYTDWKEAVKAFLLECRENKELIYNLFDCLSRDRLMRFVFSMSDDMTAQKIREYAAGRELSEETVWEITFSCRYVILGFFTQFLWNRMEGDVEKHVDNIGRHLENFVRMTIDMECGEVVTPKTSISTSEEGQG